VGVLVGQDKNLRILLVFKPKREGLGEWG